MKNKKIIYIGFAASSVISSHLNIFKKASKLGNVIVALTTDQEIKKRKGYVPELNFKQRSRLISSIKNVKKVVSSNWNIDDNFIKKHKIDILVHGDDDVNSAKNVKKKIFKRTKNVSSSQLRYRAYKNYKKIYEKK